MKKLRISVDGKEYEVEVEVLQDDESQILPSYYNQAPPVGMMAPPQMGQPQIDATVPQQKKAAPKKKVASDGNNLTAPINGVVLEIPAKVGQAVKTDEVLIILEAMKMKTNISSPIDGEITSIDVSLGDRVESGQLLLTYK